MKLGPQNARTSKNNIGQTGKKEAKAKKRQRRIAPEYTLFWSAEICEIVKTLPEGGILRMRHAAYARIYSAEAKLRAAAPFVTITSMEPLEKWWIPFQVSDVAGVAGQWFELAYQDEYIRQYVYKLAPGPDPNRPMPKMTRQQVEKAKKKKAPKGRGGPKGGGGANSARAARVRAAPKKRNVAHDFVMLYGTMRNRLNHSLVQMRRALVPRLLCSLAYMHRAYRRIAGVISDRSVSTLGAMRSFERRMHASFTRARDVVGQEAGRGASLQLRKVSRSAGPVVFLYTWIRDEAIDWKSDLFGVYWPADLFGALPEEERAFI